MRSSDVVQQHISRRRILAAGIGIGSLLVAACGQPAAPAPTPAQPAVAPTAPPAPTTAAVPTTTAAAANPTAAPGPGGTPTSQPAAQAATGAASGAPVVPLIKISTGSKPFFDEAFTTFTKQHPDIKVEPVYVNEDEYDTKADLMVAAGNPPSLFYPAASRCYRYYAAKDLILNLDPLINRDHYTLEDFNERSLAGCKWKGSLLALPKSHSVWFLIYNKTTFDQAKLAYPPTDWKDASCCAFTACSFWS